MPCTPGYICVVAMYCVYCSGGVYASPMNMKQQYTNVDEKKTAQDQAVKTAQDQAVYSVRYYVTSSI